MPFWLQVNVELIVYGATDPDAQVTVAGRPVELRPDGTFSLRFSLPDGDYELPVAAVSADGGQGRAAHLRFNRQTEYHGEVGQSSQPPDLHSPPVRSASGGP
jgi:hypothetical protein